MQYEHEQTNETKKINNACAIVDEYCEKTLSAALTDTNKQFLELCENKADTLNLSPLEKRFAMLNACGTPVWQCVRAIYDDLSNIGNLTSPRQKNDILTLNQWSEFTHVKARAFGERVKARPRVSSFIKWVRQTAEDLYLQNIKQYDWTFEDSVNELRYLIDVALEQIEQEQYFDLKIHAGVIITAIKELNAMYGYNYNWTQQAAKVKTIVFAGEDNLKD